MKHYGHRVHFPDGSTYSLFPRPSKLAQLNEKELQSRTSIGYRARSVIMASKMIANDDLHLEIFRDQDYEKAMEVLLQFQGVGPKVADCFLLYGVGKLVAAPVDVWIHRIVTNLYFRGKKMSRPNTATFLRNRFGVWAGYAQLYLFDYARRTNKVPSSSKLRSVRAS
jgi:N-glycosylase/DNA lyase